MKKYLNLFFFYLIIWYLCTFFLWFLAFNSSNSDFFLNIKSICFGNADNGFPQLYGWINLIVSPLFLLIAILIIFKNDCLFFLSIKQKIDVIIFILFLFINFFFVSLIINKYIKLYNNERKIFKQEYVLPINYPIENKDVPFFNLVDQRNQIINRDIFFNNITLLSFVFSKCTTICPKIINLLKNISSSSAFKINLLFITLDPWRDSPDNIYSNIKKYNFKNNEYFLTGSINDVNKVLDSFNIPRNRNDLDGDIIHPGLVYIIGKDSKIKFIFNSPSLEWVLEAINRINY